MRIRLARRLDLLGGTLVSRIFKCAYCDYTYENHQYEKVKLPDILRGIRIRTFAEEIRMSRAKK